jgi:hypothetical protein
LDGAFGGRHDQNGCRLAEIARRHHLAFVCGIGRQVVSGDGSPPTGPCAMLGDGKRSERQGDATWIVLWLLDFLPFYRCSYVIRWKSAAIGTPSPSPVPAPWLKLRLSGRGVAVWIRRGDLGLRCATPVATMSNSSACPPSAPFQ